MPWLVQLFQDPSTVAHSVLMLSLVAALGLAIGSIRIFGLYLGVAGVLFSGLLFGHFGFHIEPQTLGFVREFGLILFVYTIGMQVGPGFIASLRREGLPLNLMAAAIVVLGAAMTLILYFTVMDRGEFPAAVGIFAGATTNTPSLAAARQALKDVPSITPAAMALTGMGYAIAYPFGIIGIILTMVITRVLFRVNIPREAESLAKLRAGSVQRIELMNLEVRNPNLDGIELGRLPGLRELGVVISRVHHAGHTSLAMADTVLHVGDVILAVGTRPKLEELKLIVGVESDVDLMLVPSHITTRRILVTKSQALGKSVQELQLGTRFGIRVTRINRGDLEFAPTPDLRLQFGDNIVVVGSDDAIKQVSNELGDSVKRLNAPQIIPVFVGIALGVILGSWPFQLAGMPAPVRLGLAGGPLIVAIFLSRLGNIGPLVWYLPISANFMLRELGIALFLTCVGLESGEHFVETLRSGNGAWWVLYGAAVTFIPLMIVALIARAIYKLNFLSLAGLLAGSMTDPPALAFAGTITGSDAPSISYATVYPMVMLLRVVAAQAMVLFFFR